MKSLMKIRFQKVMEILAGFLICNHLCGCS